MTPELIDPQLLKFSETNARHHGTRSIQSLIESFKTFGQQKPIVVTAEFEVVAGHGQLAAALRLKLPNVWVVRTELTHDEALAYGIADNRTSELATWDEVALRTALQEIFSEDNSALMNSMGFSKQELEELLSESNPSIIKNLARTFDENCSDEVEWICCSQCNHRWAP